jgi:hypothetical protein
VPSVVNANKGTICSAFVAIDRSYIETMNAFFSNSKLHSGWLLFNGSRYMFCSNLKNLQSSMRNQGGWSMSKTCKFLLRNLNILHNTFSLPTTNEKTLPVLSRFSHVLSSDICRLQSSDQINALSAAIILFELNANTTTLPIQLRHRLVSKTWNGVLNHAELENSFHLC